jgi:hypothetical protein
MADIIDLRKKGQVVEAEHSVLPDPRKKELTLQWSAREYEKKKRSTSWFIGTGAIAAVLVVFGVISKSYFFILFVALAYAVFMMYEKKMPAEFAFSISAEGVSTGSKVHAFSELTSFWIFNKRDGEEAVELSLEADKTLTPYIRLPLKNIDPERVRGFLLNYLPEKEHKEFLTDHIERSL